MKDFVKAHSCRAKTTDILIIILLLGAISLSYRPIMGNDFINYDDHLYVVENPNVRSGLSLKGVSWSLTAFFTGNWHPLTWISHMLDVQLFGLRPERHHLVNVFWHAVNSALLFIIFRKSTGMIWPSAITAGLFAVHPLHVESVAWIAERKDTLSTFFLCLTIACYLRYVRKSGMAGYLSIVFFMALGLTAKPMLVSLPFILLLLDYWPLGRMREMALDGVVSGKSSGLGSRFASLVLEKWPFFLLAAGSSWITVQAQYKWGALSGLEYFPPATRITNAVGSYVKYIQKTLWPVDMAVFYPYPINQRIWSSIGSVIILMVLTAIILSRARRRPYLIVGWLWYLGTLIPVSGLIQVGLQSMADRYTYLPVVGLFIICSWSVHDLKIRSMHGNAFTPLFGGAVLATLIPMTAIQTSYWKDSRTLFEHALKSTEDNWVAHANLAAAFFERGMAEEAIDHYEKSLQINQSHANTHYSFAVVLAASGKIDEAIVHYRKALEIKPSDKEACNNLAFLLAGQGKYEEAERLYRMALRIDPGYQKAYIGLLNTINKTAKKR